MKVFFSLVKFNKKSTLVIYSILYSIAVALMLVIPIISQRLIDSVVDMKLGEDTYKWIALTLLLFVIYQVEGYFLDVYKGKTEEDFYVSIASRFNTVIKNQKIKDRAVLDSETVNQQMGQSYELIQDFVAYYPVKTIIKVIQCVCIVCLLMFYSVEIGIMTVLFVPFFILVSNKYSERLSKNGEDTIKSMQEVREYNADFAKYSVVERFKNISRFVQIGPLLSKYKTNKNKQIKNEAFFCNFLSYALLNLLINAALIISAIMVCSGKMTVGALFAVQLYISNYWDPIECLISIYKEFYSVKKVIVNFEELLTLECVEYEESEIPEIGIIDYVSLDKDNKELHEPVSISFTPGKLYVITGENGVGKTTLINSIMGFSDRYHGEIEVNNKGHNKNFVYSIAEPPESKFFNGLVTDKYSMGQKKIKQIQSDVMEEKDVYLFDEPTNYLDKQKKRTVIESLRRKVDQNKIVIAISHDKDIIDEADRVINLA